MAFWNNNNREESKPTWLNKIQKRFAIRTPRGWEIPRMGSPFSYGHTFAGVAVNSTPATTLTEVVVALPNDPSTNGTISSNYAYGPTGLPGVGTMDGLTFGGGSLQQFSPYFSAPFNGDSATSGGPDSAGVTHGFLTYVPSFTNGYPATWGATVPGANVGFQYGVNAYGVSTLGGLTGVTAYIKVIANDTNLTQSLTIGLSGTYNGMALYTGGALTAGTNLAANHIPLDVYNVFFGPTGDKNGRTSYRQDNIAVLVVGGATANGNKVVDLVVRDNSTSNASGVNGITGGTGFARFTLMFNRAATGSVAGNNTIRN
jgi:hypothetical protein